MRDTKRDTDRDTLGDRGGTAEGQEQPYNHKTTVVGAPADSLFDLCFESPAAQAVYDQLPRRAQRVVAASFVAPGTAAGEYTLDGSVRQLDERERLELVTRVLVEFPTDEAWSAGMFAAYVRNALARPSRSSRPANGTGKGPGYVVALGGA